jgi:twitching motility two-component system response regulator PilH
MAKVLIVDDDELIRQMYQKIFAVNGFDVEVGQDGEEAVAKAGSVNPDIIMLDIMMPKLNGLEALEKLKSDDKTKNIPVIMLTSLTAQQDAQSALAKGAAKYIVKGEYEPKEVVQTVKDYLNGLAVNQPQAAEEAPSQL